ncbi:MAG TPA: Ig-like domain-containing protein [Pirellulales bacterium]|nr:Ig-like domain-containing protein [Pirellulales bacterium]
MANPTPGLASGSVALSLVAGGATDAAGNVALAANLASLDSQAIDTVAPTVAINISNTDLTVSNNTATVTFTFSAAPTAFSLSDTTATGGTLSNLQQTGPAVWTALFTANSNTQITTASVGVTAGSYQDAAGNPGGAGSSGNFSIDTIPNSWANPAGGSWADPTNWSSGTLPSSSANVQISPFGTTPYTITILPGTTVVVNSLTISDPNVTLLDEFSLSILASLVTSAGLLQVSNGGTLSVGSAAGFTVNFAGTGGNLALVSSFTGTVDAISTADGAVTIAGAGNVTSATGDAVDLLATGGTANLAVGLTGTITGAANGITVTQNAFGNVAVTTSGPVGGEAGYGILAVESATGSGSIQVGGSGNVSGGNTNDGILAEILNAADGSGVTVNQTGSISGGYDAIHALTEGNGNVMITTGPNATITAGRFYGIEADSTGTGSISVMTTTNDVITSGSAGIVAVNLATSVPQVGGVTTSSISIMTVGTIDSGYQLTGNSNRPAGILAGYLGSQTGTPNAAVFGNVVVDNSANINAAGGDGIRAFNYGSGNVAVLDLASTTIVAPQGFGAEAAGFGTGNVSISTVASDIIDSGSSGVNAFNLATALAAGAGSSASVSASGTINSGDYLTPNGSQPAGISAGYVPGSASTPNANVNGTVSIDNFANVTASAGWGIDAFNWGNGSVTLTDEANTTVSGAQYGIAAYSQGPTSGSATINVLTGATISAGSLYGLNGISAFANNGGNVLVTTTAGDVVNSGGIGIAAGNSATSAPATSEISITTVGTINSGFDMPTGGGFSGGIWAGYGVGTVNSNILGNVLVDNSAIINAASGAGIGLYNWGVGNLTATLETSSAITAQAIGVNAYALGGGNVSINNKGTITVASGIGISAGTGNGVANSVNGIVSITNSGAISALGSSFSPVVQINNDSTQGATFTNTSTGSVIAADYAVSGFNFSVADYVGAITINNSGILSGDVQLGTATINNNAGGVWNIRGASFFGSGANTINNSGTINFNGVSSLTAGTLALANSGTINVNAGATAQVGGAVSGNGSFTIGNQAELEIVNTVGPGQTITFSPGGGLLTLDNPTGFSSTATIVAPATGDAILLEGIAVSSASNSGSITEVGGSTLTYKISGAPAADTFSVLFSSAGGSEIVLEPSGTHLTGANAAQSFTPTTAQFYQLAANATITSSTANGLNIAATDSLSTDTINVETIQPSSITVTGAFAGINVSTTGANIAITSAGNVSSSGGVGISTSSLTGSTTIVDYGNVSGASFAIEGVTTSGLLTIFVGGTAQITSANARGIFAVTSSGSSEVTTLAGVTINAGGVGIFDEDEGTSVPLADNSSITIAAAGTINSGLVTTTSEPSAILAAYFGGVSPPANIPNPPLAGIFGNVDVSSTATITATRGIGINAQNYGTGNVSVSNSGSITATAAGTTASGFAQYGILAISYGVGNVSVVDATGNTIASGCTGILAENQATVVSAAVPANVTVVALGTIDSGTNLNNSGSAPAGMLVGVDPGVADVFNANVHGNVLVNYAGSITAAAGDGMRVFDYGIGNIAINVGGNATISALNSATASSGNAPYGIGAFNYGPGNIAITTSTGDLISSGSTGIDVVNQATVIAASSDSLVTVNAEGTINSGTILNNSSSSPSGISAGFLGGTTATANTNVNGNVIVNNDANITAAAGLGIDAYNEGNGNVTVNDAAGTTVAGVQYGILASALGGGTGNVAVNVYSGATVKSTSGDGIVATSTDAGNISVITSSGDVIDSGSEGINAVSEAATIAASANSSITVTAVGTINSGTALSNGNPPAGIVAGYLGGTATPTTFPLTGLDGDVVVNNFANINPASGDGIRAFDYGTGNIVVSDDAGSITLGGASPVNGFADGIGASNFGAGNIDVSTSAGILIDSRNGGSGIVALNKAPAPWPGSSFSVPSTSFVSVLAYGTIESGTVLSGSGDPAAGILAGYNPNNTDTVDGNVHGSVSVDDYASILAPAGTDGIRGINYGTGTVTIIAEAGATINAGRSGISALGFDGGDVSVTNYATVTGTTDAIDATTTSTGTAAIDNFGTITGVVLTGNATFHNEVGGLWNLTGASTFTGGTNILTNDGTIDSTGTASITSTGVVGFINNGTINVQSGSLDIGAVVAGTGTFTIANGATLEFNGPVGATVSFLGVQGTLILDHSLTQPFAGQISNMSANSLTHDSIDLLDLTWTGLGSANYVATTATSGVLTVSDGAGHSEVFDLVNYTGAGIFTVQKDSGNGTLVFDPPATSQSTGPMVVHDPGQGVTPVTMLDPGPAQNTVVATAPDQTLSGFGASDTFVFNFAGVGHTVLTDFHPLSDVLQFDESIFANTQAVLRALHDDGHGNTVITVDSHDVITLTGVPKAQLHAADFHIV